MKIVYPVVVLVILLSATYFIFKRKRYKKHLQNLNYSEEGRNVALSISNCRKLHKELAILTHPDKFGEDKRELANRLSQEINSAKYDYKKLLILKSEVELFLKNP